MKKIILGILASLCLLTSFAPAIAADGRFTDDMNQSTQSIRSNIDTSFPNQRSMNGASWVRDFIIYIVRRILTPLIIAVSILMWILWIYDMIGNTKEDSIKQGFNYILWWAVWIIIIVSANFIVNQIANWGIFVFDSQNQIVGTLSAQRIYQRLIFPFLSLLMTFILGILFVLALIRTMTMLFSPKEDNAQKARTIIIRSAIGIIVIIFAKQLIEAVYGLESSVASSNVVSLDNVWNATLTDKQFPFIYTVINYIMWFTGFFILVIIILQGIQLLTNPTDEGIQKKMRKNIIYILIWLIIIWTSYVVTNFLIVK